MAVTAFPDDRQAPEGTVEGDAVVASNLRSADPGFVAEMLGLSDPAEIGVACQAAFELGVSVRRVASRSSDVIHLSEQVQMVQERVLAASETATSKLVNGIKAATDPEEGDLAVAVEREVQKLTKAMAAAVDEEDPTSTLSQIRDAVSETVKALGADTVRLANDIVDPSSPKSPMRKISKEIARDIVEPVNDLTASIREIKETLEVRIAVGQEQQKGSAKGRKYEEVVQTSLAEFAVVTGDVAEAVGDLPGADGSSRVGDHLVTFAVAGREPLRIVLEAKDKKLSMAKVRDELNQACENRLADVGVMVFSSIGNAPTASPFMRIAAGRYVVVLDKEKPDSLALRVAYQSARIDAIALSAERDESALDVEGLLADIEGARGMFSILTKMKTALTKSARGTKDATENLALLKEQLGATLDGLEGRVRSDAV